MSKVWGKVCKFLFSRMVITMAIILLQLVLFLAFWIWLSDYLLFTGTFFSILSIIILIYIINKDELPSYKIGWIILFIVMPLLGGMLYLAFGNKRPARKLTYKIGESHNNYVDFLKPNEDIARKIEAQSERMAGSVRYLQEICQFPAWTNTQTTYYPIGEKMYKDMLEELDKAQRFILLEYFIIAEGGMWEGIFEILKRKSSQGLDVRLIYDDMGCLNLLSKNFQVDMEKAGIQCFAFNPFVPILSLAVNNRDHRKIMVIDGKVAFTGGINLADEYINTKIRFGHWKDTGLKIQGDAVRNFTLMFLELWNAFRKTDENIDNFLCKGNDFVNIKDGFVIPFADSPLDNETVGQNIYIDILNQAKRYVYIFTPYLIIDSDLQNALRLAAKRGVDVRIVTPGIPDKKIVYRVTRSYYPLLLQSNVKIYEYTPGFLHAKSYVCDDEIAVIGTINMDYRSLCLHFECGTYLYKTESILEIKNDYLRTLEACREIKIESCKQGWIWQLVDNIIKVFAPLM